MTIVYRSQLNRPMTWAELDGNWSEVQRQTALAQQAAVSAQQAASSVDGVIETASGYATAASTSATQAQQAVGDVQEIAESVTDVLSSSVRAPDGETLTPLPSSASRALSFPSFGDMGELTTTLFTDIPSFGTDGKIPLEQLPSVLQNPVSSVAGRQGDVVLKTSDITLPVGINSPTVDKNIQFVTPEQFGAIGDGTVHPLSERYSTLVAAQAVYPHVTALTQTIDWAACQGAENYACGKYIVQGRPYASYHLGRDGLLIDQYSQWVGVIPSTQELKVTEFKKTFPTSTPVFQQDYIVRVRPGNNDSGQFYKAGIRFEGFRLKYDVARRYATKGTNTICFHAGHSIKSNFDFSTWGGEYGVYTWIHFGNKGHLRIDNCHKGYWSVPALGDNERAGAGTTTSNYYRIECDVTPFPITIGRDAYSQYTGFFEGVVATDGNYDSANETACGITIIGSAQNISFKMGIEKFEGVHVTKVGAGETAECTFEFSPFFDAHYLMSTGNNGSDFNLRTLNGTVSARVQLPAAQRAYFNVLSGSGRAIFNMMGNNYYLGHVDKEVTSTRYLLNLQETSSIVNFIGGQVGFTPEAGMAPVSFSVTEAMKAQVTSTGCRSMDIWCAPTTSWRLVGQNRWRSTARTPVTMTVDTGNGQFADFTAPTGYTVTDVIGLGTNLGISGAAIGARPSIIAPNGTAMRVGTSYTGATILTASGIVEITQ